MSRYHTRYSSHPESSEATPSPPILPMYPSNISIGWTLLLVFLAAVVIFGTAYVVYRL